LLFDQLPQEFQLGLHFVALRGQFAFLLSDRLLQLGRPSSDQLQLRFQLHSLFFRSQKPLAAFAGNCDARFAAGGSCPVDRAGQLRACFQNVPPQLGQLGQQGRDHVGAAARAAAAAGRLRL
jgi:hypothetical protein